MDPSRFDSLVRTLTMGGSRRRLLGVLSALPLVGAALAAVPEDATAAKAKGKRTSRGSGHNTEQERQRTGSEAMSCARRCRKKASKQARRKCRKQCTPPTPECTASQDCPAGELCESGVCISVPDQCTGNADCDACERCQGGVCVAQCQPDEICRNGQCETIACTSDRECGDCSRCIEGRCRWQCTVTEVCLSGAGGRCCQPRGCPAGTDCGTVDDGCGGQAQCGSGPCSAPETCGGSGTPNQCGCTPSRTCADYPGQCGTLSDGCAGTISCTCTAPTTCGGGNPGTPGVCGCTKTTCAAAGAQCESIPDGCGGQLPCGPCPTPANPCQDAVCSGNACTPVNAPDGRSCGRPGEVCQAGSCVCPSGVICPESGCCPASTNVCDGDDQCCVPQADATTCAGTCGIIANNCDQPVDCTPFCPGCCAGSLCQAGTENLVCGTGGAACGPCLSPQTCGGGGIPKQCGCTPLTTCPGGANCGTISDGCGSTVRCGPDTCAGTGQTCGGGGTPNRCGCTPTTCTAQNKNCGTIPDGCGGTLSCGSCPFPSQPCTNNVCGACVPTSCIGKACGASNDCGGTCTGCSPTCTTGTCPENETCQTNGTCLQNEHKITCTCEQGQFFDLGCVRTSCFRADEPCRSACASFGGFDRGTCNTTPCIP